MKTIRVIQSNLKRVITNPAFYACVLLTVILCFSATIYTDYTQKDYSIYSVFMEFSREDMLWYTDLSSYSALVHGSGSWLSLFIPILAAFTFIPLLCNERSSGAMRYLSFRVSKLSFGSGNYISALLVGGLAILCGFIVFAIAVYIMFPNISEYSEFDQEIYFQWLSYSYRFFDNFGFPYLVLLKLLEMFIYGMLSVIPALLLTSVLRNKYLIICIPFFFVYTISQIVIRFSYDALPPLLIALFNPSTPSRIFSSGSYTIWILVFYTALIICSYLFYIIMLNRRVDYGE
ncbi:MAG: hypothetical protein LBC71_00570 [Oscillospiraceae bacterium]|jgi:hypothetical protein|nr:hypothetical protein [Oscillospiraceae bacterium]